MNRDDLKEAIARIIDPDAFKPTAVDAKGEDDWAYLRVTARLKADDILTAANARADKYREALEPFAAIAAHDIGEDESDSDSYQPMRSGFNRAPRLTVGDLRRARAALASTETER